MGLLREGEDSTKGVSPCGRLLDPNPLFRFGGPIPYLQTHCLSSSKRKSAYSLAAEYIFGSPDLSHLLASESPVCSSPSHRTPTPEISLP
jgi:hypothetical protein